MTVPRMTSQNHHRIISSEEGLRDEDRIDSSRTHHPDDSCIGGILKTGDTRQVCTRIGTPVTEER